MDTAAYLSSQGWAGHGHALHHSGRGITKPIAIAQKNNVLGVGKKKHDAHADQWWARAFDETFKGINATKNESTGRTEAVVITGAAKLAGSQMRGGFGKDIDGLYSRFVKGDGLQGTLRSQEAQSATKDLADSHHIERRGFKGHDEPIDALPKVKVEKRKSKQRKLAHAQDSEVNSCQRERRSDGREEEKKAEEPTLQEKHRKKRRREKDVAAQKPALDPQMLGFAVLDAGQRIVEPEPTEEEQRRQRKKARKEEKARLAVTGKRAKKLLVFKP